MLAPKRKKMESKINAQGLTSFAARISVPVLAALKKLWKIQKGELETSYALSHSEAIAIMRTFIMRGEPIIYDRNSYQYVDTAAPLMEFQIKLKKSLKKKKENKDEAIISELILMIAGNQEALNKIRR